MDSIKKAMIAAFLKEFKKLAVSNEVDIFIKRTEYKDTFIELGITLSDARNELMSLSIENYCSGPEPDKDRPGSVWEFGKNFEGKEVYIKLKIAEIDGKKYAKCISFHKAKFPMCYPLKN
jgi:hypothetical protein